MYQINEIFYSLQGEGMRVGTANHFVRFTGCNMKCDLAPSELSPGGFACDTEFTSGRKLTIEQILAECSSCKNVIFTGGEPALQVDHELVQAFKQAGYCTCIETNGTIDVATLGLDWITLSPKVAEHALKVKFAHELKYVRHAGQGIPVPSCEADFKLISPAFSGSSLDRKTLEWCIKLIKENPDWRLTCQLHKLWSVR